MSLTDTIQILKELRDLAQDTIDISKREHLPDAQIVVDTNDVVALNEALDRLDGIKRIQQMLYPNGGN